MGWRRLPRICVRVFDLLPESNNQLHATTIGSKQRKTTAGSSKQHQAANANSWKQQQSAAISSNQQQSAAISSNQQQSAAISSNQQQAAEPDEGWKFVRSAFEVALRNSIINTFSRQIGKFIQTPHVQVRVHYHRITLHYVH